MTMACVTAECDRVARDSWDFQIDPLPNDLHAAPRLCAGIIGFRSLRVAGVQPEERVGLFGFGASAHLNSGLLT
jgi:propanol-preferring alcohol dehydrogenase